ncbi:MAG: TMEM175 family protein [Sphingobacteriales bacterium]
MAEANPNSRLEAFCDGVFAIALTLLIIDIKIPSTVEINNTVEFWLALKHIAPSIFAFLLSFGVILITWVNHHHHLKLLNKSCGSFLYANGFLLLTVVFIPFPTSLQGEYLLTDHAAPAVILYNSVLALQAIGWILISHTAFKNRLGKSEKATLQIRKNGKFGYFAFALYTLCAITAFWFPHTIAIITTITWIFWLLYGINIKHEQMN